MKNFKRDYNDISFNQYQIWDARILNLLDRLQQRLRLHNVNINDNDLQLVLGITDEQLYRCPKKVLLYLQTEYDKDEFEAQVNEIMKATT
ncbi:hypothetical protein PYL56_08840 [Staphylococcus succinus]|uniref:hypothetical protein n=1 Tax=Staphylococcus succinus TaxID=61015 RepID=UPI00248149BC|nr:hypothetical protein [Staphylococcus succinus]MDH9161477.1 hypothetical protein [Staphylococcus succinus]